jgi:hypothetical protein
LDKFTAQQGYFEVFVKKGSFSKKRGNKGYQLSLGVLLDQHPKISALFLGPCNIPLDLRL